MLSKINVLWVCADSSGHEDAPVPSQLAGTSLAIARGIPEALQTLAACRLDAVVAGFPAANWTPEEFLEQVHRLEPSLPVMILDPRSTLGDAVRLTRLGAFHVFGTQWSAEELSQRLEAAVEDRRSRELGTLNLRLSHEPWRRWLVGESRALQKVVEIVRLVGARRCTVLITGETGTGKEMAARALHGAGPRAHLPMVTVNCSALPENLLEAELFGHVKGAFTGAIHNRIGRFEQAHGSTLFLDEIGDMPLDLQVKLLRVLQEREFQRLGSSETIRVDVRVVAASNANLVQKVEQGKFREDLFYRLNVVPLTMPPLRERRSDIPLLAHHFVDKICRQEDTPPRSIPPETLERLVAHAWPGNVRQLENAVEMAVALSGTRTTLRPCDFPLPAPMAWKSAPAGHFPTIPVPDDGLDFEQTIGKFERSILEQALERAGGNKKRAADLLGLKRTTLSAKLRTLEARAAV